MLRSVRTGFSIISELLSPDALNLIFAQPLGLSHLTGNLFAVVPRVFIVARTTFVDVMLAEISRFFLYPGAFGTHARLSNVPADAGDEMSACFTSALSTRAAYLSH